MLKPITIIKRFLISVAAVVLLNIPAAAVFADDPAPCIPPPQSSAGVHWPTGSDASTFTYQCDGTYAGQWTNAYYVYDPSTSTRSPLFDLNFQYDCTAQTWTMVWYYYSPANGSWSASRIDTSTNPGLATNCPVTTPAGGSGGSGGVSSAAGINGTGPNSTNGINNDTNINSNTTNNNILTLNNGVFSQASSGNTFVQGNTTGGSALSGDATSVSNIANLLQSTSNVFGPGVATFTADINGDVNGDFMFDPSAVLSDTGPSSSNSANNKLTVNTNDTNNTNAQINNNINVGASTGNATVADNTTGGDATSGNAHAIVNLMNLINSTIQSGQSFIGTININGNLNGDILLPADMINALLASTGPGSSNSTNNNVTSNSTETNNNNLGINNNVSSNAQTGTANVSGNTTGGSATSGTAGTNTTMLNLTGSNVVGKNDLLVFVNVLGHWVGMIVNAPAGSTAAELGGGITQTGPNSSNTTNNSVTTNSNTTNNNNLGINNNVNVHANSGNANVSGNTTGGNAKSGNADTAVNIVNVEGVNINVSDWFGVLFINVFGNWTGSFGINTSAGDPLTPASDTVPASFQFVPNPAVAGSSKTSSSNTSGGSTSGSSSDGVVLAASNVQKAAATLPSTDGISASQKTTNQFLLPIGGALLALIILVAGERRRLVRH